MPNSKMYPYEMQSMDDFTVKKLMDGLSRIIRGDKENRWEDDLLEVCHSVNGITV